MEEQHKAKSVGREAKKGSAKKPATTLTEMTVQRTAKQPLEKAKDAASAAPISTEQRRQLIAQSAYFKALSRGFEGGDPVADWLQAEQEVDKAIAHKAD